MCIVSCSFPAFHMYSITSQTSYINNKHSKTTMLFSPGQNSIRETGEVDLSLQDKVDVVVDILKNLLHQGSHFQELR